MGLLLLTIGARGLDRLMGALISGMTFGRMPNARSRA